MAARTIRSSEMSEMTKYGTVLPTMNENVLRGAIRICSIVPRSFSRTTESAVETTAVIIARYAISPGTRKSVLRSWGLYQMRGSTRMGGPLVPVEAAMRLADSVCTIDVA